MMPHTKLTKSQTTHNLFASLDRGKAFDGHRRSVGYARRETRTCRLIPCGEVCAAAQLAHLALVDSDLYERAANPMLLRRAAPRAIVAKIVRVRAVNNECEGALTRQRSQLIV